LLEIAGRIPPDVNWVLQVNGHTDKRPIKTARFPSNWELSTERALSIVRYLINKGIPPNRLAATGFAEFDPIDPADNLLAYGRNRRIELKFTNR
jgi:chemotaxis protein MotB